jgi:predicted ferric reductase
MLGCNLKLTSIRLAAARNGQINPSKPKSLPARINATATAIVREAQNATLDPIKIWRFHLRMPTVGRVSLVVANVIVLVVLCFVGFTDTQAFKNLEDIGYRTGFVSLAQIPLLFLLASKNNIIGFLTGMSYERINWLHRWCARCLLFTSTIHFGYWLTDWWPYGSFVAKKIRTDPLTYRGVIAWAFLVWIVFSSMAPIRRWNYEFFVIQHLMTFSVFIGMVYIHTPAECHVYIWIPVGLFFFDRVVRALYVIYTNISFFHPKQRRVGQMKGLWACQAEFASLPHNTTRITIKNPPINWNAGQHVFLSCHSVVPLQSHPFTIASIPEDGKIEFYVKAEKGATKKFFGHAEKLLGLPHSETVNGIKSVAIEGPYGRIRPLRQFDSVIFFAGSTGATFTMPLLRDIIEGWKQGGSGGTWRRPAGVVTRHVRFVWVVKSRGQLSWFASQLSKVINDVAKLNSEGHEVEVETSVYCTCDDEFTEEHKSILQSLGYSHEKKYTDAFGKGKIEELDEPSEKMMSEEDILKKRDQVKTTIQEVESTAESSAVEGACGTTTTCCCTANVEDENEIQGEAQPCCCGGAPRGDPRKDSLAPSTESAPASTSKKLLVHPEISVLAGRPMPRNIIRKSLEQALGESAVICCGPQGLVDSVRSSVVRLSDERAVHKGTGAQGIYVHCESFSL